MFELSTSKDELISGYKLQTDAVSTVNVDRNGLTLGRWSGGLMSCYGDCIPNGLISFFCPGISVAQIAARLGLMRYKLVLEIYGALYLLVLVAFLIDHVIINIFCLLAAIAAVLVVCRLRTKMRVLFDIPGNKMLDLTLMLVCGPCAIAQMARHAGAYHSGTCSFRARSTLEGYVRQ